MHWCICSNDTSNYILHILPYSMPRIIPTLCTCQGYSIFYLHSHISYGKDAPYYTYPHTYIMPSILPTTHTLTHALCQAYSLLHIHSHMHYAKDTPYYTYTHKSLTHTFWKEYLLLYIHSHMHNTSTVIVCTFILLVIILLGIWLYNYYELDHISVTVFCATKQPPIQL